MSNKARAFFEEAKLTEEYWVAKAKMDFATELARNATEANFNGKTFAEKIGKTAAYISKIFSGNTNLTIESMVTLARAAGANIEFKFTPMGKAVVTKVEEPAVAKPVCTVSNIPTPLMKALTNHKQELNKAVAYSKIKEHCFTLEKFYSTEETMAFLERNKAFGAYASWSILVDQPSTLIAKKA